MKSKINYILVFFIFLLCFTTCQNESDEVDNPTEQEVIVPNSTLANLMFRTTANSSNLSSILEDYSCFAVALPVSIVVNGETIVVVSENDIVQLGSLLDDDDLEFVYPITIIFGDYSELVIENEEQLETYIDDCDEDEETANIECVDFVYPISFSIFNSEFNLVDTVSIADDEALYSFLEGLDEDENATIVSIDYPVTLVYANGETVEVNTNQELVDAISAAEEDCDETEVCDATLEEIQQAIQSCTLEAELYNANDETLNEYVLNFGSNNNVTVNGEPTVSEIGNWTLATTAEGFVLAIDGLETFSALNDSWIVTECEEDEFEFTNGEIYLELETDCDDDCSQEDVSTYLTSCNIVPTVNGYTSPLTLFQFSEDNSLFTMYQGDLPHNGTWSVDSDDNGVYIVINFNGLEAYNGQWYLQECYDEGLSFYQGDNVLILGCDENHFECFENIDVEICDELAPYDDGITTIDLNTIFDCPQDNIVYGFYITEMDAHAGTNQYPTDFTSFTNPQIFYVKAELISNPSLYEIFTVEILIEDCSEDCENEGVLTDDLVIYMPFSNEVKDLISDWELASFSNGFVEDRNGNATCAIEFTETNPITIPTTDDSEVVQGESFSISLWFKMQNTDIGDLEIFFRSPGNATQGFQLGVYDLNSPLFSDNLSTSIWDNDWNNEVDVEWENTDWHHLVATVDENNTIKLYRDGVLRNSIENSSFSIGAQPVATYLLGEGFTGYLDDLRVYKRALSTEDIQVLYQLESDCNTCLDD